MKKLTKVVVCLSSLFLFVLGLSACGKINAKEKNKETKKEVIVKLGLVGADTDVWDDVKIRLAKKKIHLHYVKFTDYMQPNAALAQGEIDLNAFQHQAFLDTYNKEHHTSLVSIGNTVSAPLGLFSDKIKHLSEIKKGSNITIPNDVTNEGRALLLLQEAKLIKVDPNKKQTPTLSDIQENKKNLTITEVDASQTARTLKDVTASVINSGVAVDAKLNPTKDAIFLEPVNKSSKPYVNIIAANKKEAKKKIYQTIVHTYQSERTKKVIKATSKGSSIPAWESFGKK